MPRLSHFFLGGGKLITKAMWRGHPLEGFPRGRPRPFPLGTPRPRNFRMRRAMYICFMLFFNYGYPGARCMFWGGGNAGRALTCWGAPWGHPQAGNGFVFVLALFSLGAIEELGQGLLAWGTCPWPVFGCASARWGLHGGACKRARGVYLYLYVACSPT